MKRIICAVLFVCMLLCLGACSGDIGPTTQTTAPTIQAGSAEPTNEQISKNTEPSAPTEDPSLAIFRQAMVETPQLFAVAYFGYVSQDTDPFEVMQEAAPQLCENLPFLLTLRKETIVGAFGHLFCIVPKDENATVAVDRYTWNGDSYENEQVLYRSEQGAPILVMCPNENGVPDTFLTITDSDGTVTIWCPHIGSSGRVAALCDDQGESLLMDFTPYDDTPIPYLDMVGTWALRWTEVEGDRVEATPGSCAVTVTTDGMGFFWISYENKDFPEENFTDRELLITSGQLYPDCSNSEWYAQVNETGEAVIHHAVTVQADGTLLMQFSWEMDGMPMVSYGWYQKK